MVVEELDSTEVLKATRAALLLPSSTSAAPLDEPLLGAALRRLAGVLCPCSRATLVSALADSLAYLASDPDELREQADVALERLTIGGDLLELSSVTTVDPDVRGTWVFAAPPAFVRRPGGVVLLLGVVPDEASPLPEGMVRRLEYQGYARILAPQPGEDLPLAFRDLGLVEIPEDVWLKTPRPQAADVHRAAMDRRLDAQPASGEISDLLILDPERSVRYYRGRWTPPAKRSGRFVARRPQAYGAPIWGYVELDRGAPVRFLDFPLRGERFRGCDTAWRLQLAIDYCRGTPQRFRRRAAQDGGTMFELFSPLPMWAQRRLTTLGRPVSASGALCAFWLPASEADTQEAFLTHHLWLERATSDH